VVLPLFSTLYRAIFLLKSNRRDGLSFMSNRWDGLTYIYIGSNPGTVLLWLNLYTFR